VKRWRQIKYRDFYDIPRIFLVPGDDRFFLFDCPFDSGDDEYGKTFKVYLMPNLPDEILAGSWEDLAAKAERLLGEVPTSEVQFDSTLRQEINANILARFGF
jgi:hypothetical protein